MYEMVKVLHLVAAIHWIGGVLFAAMVLFVARSADQPGRLLTAARRWDLMITVPAMIATWILGLAMARLGDWFGSGWLNAKLVLVVLLAGLHGILSGALNRKTAHPLERGLRLVLPAMSASIAVVAALAVTKPI